MLVVRDSHEMKARSRETWRAGQRIAFVPTMGSLHEGHLSLLREGRRHGESLILSIFVNPLQFGPAEDLHAYPRDEAGDLEKARGCGVDIAYCPDVRAMYPDDFQTVVQVRELEKGLCGERRPGHFAGVVTVVLKLFQQVQPHVAIFGQKDYQQLQIIRQMTLDLDLGVKIVAMPIVREPDGLAMSSRNAYLTPEQRMRAVALSRGLRAAAASHAAGTRSAAELQAIARAPLEDAGLQIDYLELRDAQSLAAVTHAERPVILAVAAFVGRVRLIDNVVLS